MTPDRFLLPLCLLLILAVTLVSGGEVEVFRRDDLDFGFVPSVVYETLAYYEPGAMGPLFHLAHAFLYLVQPNPFPSDLIVNILQQNKGGIKLEELQKPENIILSLQVLYYETGFVVLGAVGGALALLTPLIGLCFCACRCCENCGGEMHQRHRRNADCRRGFHVASLAASSTFVAAGVLIAYAANHNVTSQIKSARRLVSSNFRDLRTLAGNTPAQVNYLTAQYTTVKNKVLSDLDNVGPLLGGQIQNQLERDLMPALDNALRVTAAMRETTDALENVSTSLETLQEATARLQGSLELERTSLLNTLTDQACGSGNATHTCNGVRAALVRLALAADFHQLPAVDAQLVHLEKVMKTDLSFIVQKGYSALNNTSRIVSDQTEDVVVRVKALLEKSGAEITSFTAMFPVGPALENFTMFLMEGQRTIEAYYPQMEQFDFYRWIGCVLLCCMVALILAFNVLGLMCGVCGHDKNATPTTRGCLSNTGGNLLMAGVGFSFMFYWLLMGTVVATFLTGGNVEKLVCEPLASRQLFQIIDTPYMVHPAKKNFLPGMLFQNPDIDLTISSVYRDCHENRGIYSALHLENLFNFIKFVNATVYNHELTRIFEGVNVDLQGVTLLEQESKDNLISFVNAGLGEVHYQAYLTEVNKGVTIVDLLLFANELDAQADHLPRGALGNALRGHASRIRNIHKEQVLPMEQAMKFVRARGSLSQSISFLQTAARELPNKVSNVLSAVESLEYLIANNASRVVEQETEKYLRNLVGYLQQYISWVEHSLTLEVAQCKPISNIIDSLEIVACSFLVDSLNTFWLGLGVCCLFLIPSVIISIKLAKFYRRMDTEDVLDDGPENWS